MGIRETTTLLALAGLGGYALWFRRFVGTGTESSSGAGYVVRGCVYFLNRRGTQMKILVWESGGFLIYHKRLEVSTFERGVCNSDGSLRWDALVLMVEGVVLKGQNRHKRFEFEGEKT